MKPSRFQRLRRIAKSDPVGLDRAVAAGLGEMRKLLEAGPRDTAAPKTQAKLDQKKRPARQDLLDDIGGAYDELGFGDLDGDPNPLLAAQIDNRLGVGIWTGSTFEDRTTHAIDGFARNLVSDIETSLLAQESYGDFEARLFKKMGIADTKEPLGTLAQFDTLIRSEANLAWNEAMIAANAGTDTALVWECQLKPTSTPGCIWRHGRTIDELQGETPLRHFGCGCFVTTIPDPDSQDPARAEAGRAMLAQMAAEREEAGGGDEFEESAKPSRFLGLRRLAEADSYFKDCPRVPAGGEPHPGACMPSGEGMPDGRGKDHFKTVDPARDKVDGRVVRDGPVPNTDSIASSFTDYEVLPGIREVPMSDFDVESLRSLFYAKDDFDRVETLAEKIRQSGEITPLIVAVDREGSYVLEGGHRLGALWKLGAKSFPAMVVLDRDT